jgi:hypothetical protein
MRAGIACVTLVLALGCARSADDDPAAAHVARGDRELAAGRIAEAKSHFDTAQREARDAAWRTRAECRILGIRRIELTRQDALAALETLSAELASHPSPAAEAAYERQREAVLQIAPEAAARTDLLRAEGVTTVANSRAAEHEAIEELITAKHLSAAVLVLRDLELRRAPGDTKDLEELLVRIGAASEAAADHRLAMLPKDPTEAIASLDEGLIALAGTPGAARLLVERAVLAGSIKRPGDAASRESGVPTRRH